ncbi:MAG TPA: hypothetical protein VHI78_06995 [Bacteroidales bacterium]|jgi:hypothetical protein|nr:hypothetical protein [Bacteroidales bacterium]
MKRISGILFPILILFACSSPEKLLQKGNYDGIIEKSVKNLIKKPESSEDAMMLDKAYKLANERDLERIKYLKTENNPNTWDEMLSLYSNLKNRQASVRRVLPLHIGNETIQYQYVDYDAEIVSAKRKAADYYNSHGRKLMENKDKESYRQAYYELVRAKDYSGDSYYDLDQIINEARYLGMSRVLISVVNKTIINLPQEFSESLVAVNARELNSEWVEYYTRKMDDNVKYDYYIDIILQTINVSPDLTKDRDFIEKKKIDDGFQYVLDAKGNVMKDTAGNDIKLRKYKEIQCTVIETKQMKDCNITGEIEFISANPQALLKKQPVAAGTHFEYVSARAIGDVNALSEETKKMIEAEPMPFPNDIQMILDCTEALKKSIHDAVNYNRGTLR